MDSFIKSGKRLKNTDTLMCQVIKNPNLKKQGQEASGKLFGLDRFDLEKITNLPKPLLDKLSWEAGQDRDFFATGEFKGWPLRVWPTFKRPFLKLNNKHYCFDHSSLFDNIYRVLQRIICNLKPEYKETWNQIQKNTSEQLPFTYLDKIMPGSQVFQDVFYKTNDWCEVDRLIAFEDHLFIIEVKAGAFTYTTPATDLNAHIKSLENLILKPSDQGNRFLDYLKSAHEIKIYNENHSHISTIKHDDYRHITVCAVTLDSFTELARLKFNTCIKLALLLTPITFGHCQ